MTEFIWKHNNITYKITKSDRKNKKLQAVYINPHTGKQNTIHFGQTGFQVYQDKTGLLDKKWIHGDKQRRDNFRSRFRSKFDDLPSPLTLSWNLLW